MSSRTFLVLVCALLVTLAMLYSSLERKQNFDQELLFPGLAPVINDIDQIVLSKAGRETIATLKRTERGWVVAERNNHPADIGRIRQNMLTLASARLIEEKTSNPELYERIGVEDIDGENASGIELSIRGPGETMTLIVGDTGVQGDNAYVRRGGEARSWLASADLDLGRGISDWLQSEVVDIASSAVHAVTITHPDGEQLRIEKADRDDANFAVIDIPDGREVSYAAVANGIGLVLTELSFDDVAAAAEVTLGDVAPVITRFECFDGLIVVARTYESDDATWTAFEFSSDTALAARFGDADQDASDKDLKVAGHAEELNTRHTPWLYRLPSYKVDQFVKRMDDMLKPAA